MASAQKRGQWWRGRYKDDQGEWQWLSRDEAGNRFRTKAAAKAAAAAMEAKVARGEYIAPMSSGTLFKDWVTTWLETLDVGPLSEVGYRQRLTSCLLPRWGNVAIGDITTSAYLVWVKELKAAYKPNTLDGMTGLFRTILDDAVRERLRSDNPVPLAARRRRGRFKKRKSREETPKVIATPRQALLIARNALEHRGLSLYVHVLLHAYCGLRIGEVAGLRRDDVFLEDGGRGCRLIVASQSQYVDSKPTLIDPKYDSGRDLIIPPFLAVLLREQLDSHKGEFVITAPKGGRVLTGGDWYTTSWDPCVEGIAERPVTKGRKAYPGLRPVAGVAGMVPHGLRHSHRTWLDEAGHPRVAIEERMGHELPGVEGTYSHTTLTMELAIAETLQRLWEESWETPDEDPEWGPMPTVYVPPPRKKRSS